MSKLLDLKKRGFFQHISDENLLEEENLTFYFGIDPTAAYVHLGHFIPIKLSLELLKYGYKLIILIGGFTGKIGDPTGKKKERLVLNEEETEKNTSGIKSDLEKIFSGLNVTWVNNKDWLENMNLSEFLNYSSKVCLSRILRLKTVKDRLSASLPITMKEVNYSLLQSIDHLHLFKKYNCRLQIGGGDQWGNISQAIHLVEMFSSEKIYGICTPLLLDKSGAKISKTSINSSFVEPKNIWQFIYNLEDENINFLYKIFVGLEIPDSFYEARLKIIEEIILIYYKDVRVFENIKKEMTIIFDKNTSKDMSNITYTQLKLSDYSTLDLLIKFIKNQNKKINITSALKTNAIFLNEENILSIKDICLEKKKYILKIGKRNIFFIELI